MPLTLVTVGGRTAARAAAAVWPIPEDSGRSTPHDPAPLAQEGLTMRRLLMLGVALILLSTCVRLGSI
jgi:hypothetical protein